MKECLECERDIMITPITGPFFIKMVRACEYHNGKHPRYVKLLRDCYKCPAYADQVDTKVEHKEPEPVTPMEPEHYYCGKNGCGKDIDYNQFARTFGYYKLGYAMCEECEIKYTEENTKKFYEKWGTKWGT